MCSSDLFCSPPELPLSGQSLTGTLAEGRRKIVPEPRGYDFAAVRGGAGALCGGISVAGGAIGRSTVWMESSFFVFRGGR